MGAAPALLLLGREASLLGREASLLLEIGYDGCGCRHKLLLALLIRSTACTITVQVATISSVCVQFCIYRTS